MKPRIIPALLLCTFSALSIAQQGDRERDNRGDRDFRDEQTRETSPVRQIERDPNRSSPRAERPDAEAEEFRSLDGSGNNQASPLMNAHSTELGRLLPAQYADAVAAIAGEDRPSPRQISNLVSAQATSIPNTAGATDYLWQWGQFLDHDIDLTDGVDPAEPAPIAIPTGDPWFDPFSTGQAQMDFNRSIYANDSGSSPDNPREQINEITGWIDASNVYGSDDERAIALRLNDGSGKLKTSAGNLLPFNTEGLANAGGSGENLFLAGDVRANEQAGLSVMHTLFVREHNRIAERLADRNPELSGEEIYQQARAVVAAQMQVITYREFLPMLLGPNALPEYQGYKPEVDATVANSFSTAAYRLGHSMLSPAVLRLDADNQSIAEGPLALREAFFAPDELQTHGLEPILRGLAAQTCQEIDIYVVDDIRNFLFGAPGSGGFDLASLNIQRGRDHGLPGYNAARISLGLGAADSFADISSDPEVQARLEQAYGQVDAIDLWVGGLAEDHVKNAMVGETFHQILTQQFANLRDGDRFWYENVFSGRDIDELERTTLARIIRRNTEIGRELQRDVFQARITVN